MVKREYSMRPGAQDRGMNHAARFLYITQDGGCQYTMYALSPKSSTALAEYGLIFSQQDAHL